MNKPFVKLIPDKNVKDIILASVISFENNSLVLSLKNTSFKTGEFFDVIIEEGTQLKFMRADLKTLNQSEGIFEISDIRVAIKREYERISLILDVIGFDFSAQTDNISAGGMQIRANNEIEKNKIYDLKIDYISKKIPVKYEVLRVAKDKNKFLISGRFIDLAKDSKAFIIQQNIKNKIFGLRSSPLTTNLGGKK
jgi:hypothetical protein